MSRRCCRPGLGNIAGPQVRERGSFQSGTLVSAFRYSLSEALVPRRREKKERKKKRKQTKTVLPQGRQGNEGMAGGSHLSSVTQLLSVGATFTAQNFARLSGIWLCFPGVYGKGTLYSFPASFTDLVSQNQGESILCSLPLAHLECRVLTVSPGCCAQCLKMPGEKGMTRKPSGLHS